MITDDAAPAGKKEFLIWTPGPKGVIYDATKLFCELMKRGVRTIVFCKVCLNLSSCRDQVLRDSFQWTDSADLRSGPCLFVVVAAAA